MAKQIFKGFKQVAYSDSLTYENGYLYLVRTASGETADGFLYFNGKKYGTSQAAIAELEAVLGELPSGETTFVSWIQKISSALTVEAAAREAMDESLLGDPTGETTEGATIYDVKRKVESISGSTHTHNNKEVLDTISAEKVATWDGTLASANTYTDEKYSAATAYTDSKIADETARTESTYAKPADITTAIGALDATVSGESNGVQVTVAQSDGVLTGVTVVAPDFDNVYDEKGAAASAETNAKAYTDSELTAYATSADTVAAINAAYSAATADTASQIADAIAAETARTESEYAKPADIATAIEALDASAVTVGASETVASVSETDGVITVTKQDIAISHSAVTDWDTELAKKQDVLVFKTAYDAETNKAVTESDIAFLEGAMHFVGVSSTNPVTEGPTIPGVSAFTSGDVCLYGTKEFIYDGTNWHEIGDEGIYVTKTTTIAGVDLQDNISKAELLSALNVEDGAQVNVLEGVKVNGTDLTVSGKSVDITITSGTTSGTVAVNGTDVAVTGLKSAAYEETTAFDAAGAAESAKTEAIAAASAYTNSAIAALDATVSGASNGVEVEVVEADGKITNVNVTAPDFANTYDEKGAAASAETSAKDYADTKIASAITSLDATVSGESNGVQVTVAQSDGVLTGVTVVAPDFGNTYDEKGAAESAKTEAIAAASAYTNSAITALDATVSGASSGNVTTVEVVETNGVVTAVNVTNNLSADSDNALSIKSDGLFAAIYYEDEDTV